jgi:ApaG protein
VSGSEASTRQVSVRVESQYSPEHSNAQQQQWFFLYTVRITNHSAETVQLLNRHWIITDALGEVREVRGSGVVGRQPVLKTGESFEYTSGCPLPTPFGSMRGSYEMVTEHGERFLAEVAPFMLRQADAYH